jgi:outer membrane protein OmpA-like peptidoglycan-associated protein
VILKNFAYGLVGLLAASAACGRGGDSGDRRHLSETEQHIIGDNDDDGVADLSDLDDDNDGVLDQIECPAETLQGKEFWMIFNPNNAASGRRDLFFAGPAGTTVTIGSNAPLTIPASGLLQTDTGLTRVPSPNTIQSGKALHILTSAGVTVFANNFQPFTVDAFTVLPVGLLGTDYYAAGYPNSIGQASQISVVATQDNTSVTIGTAAPIILNTGQSFLRSVVGDATGIHVIADKPIAVNSGDSCLNTGAGACDHVEEMLTPTDAWSSEFFVPVIPQGTNYRVVASQANTVVSVNGVVVATIGQGQFYQGTGAGVQITSSKPTQAYMIALGDTSGTGDPAFLLLPGRQNAVGAATFAALAADNVNTLVVSMPTAAIATLRVDGALVTPTWTAYPTGGFSHAQVVVAAGDHTVSADQAFIPVVWGEKSFESYAYVAGLQVQSNACTLDTDNDGIVDSFDLDSDGDGVTDVDEAGGMDTGRDGHADGPVDVNGVPSSSGGGITPPDTDGDGIPDTKDPDTDNDGVNDRVDSNRTDAHICRDVDSDTCDDCINTGNNNSGGSVSNDGLDSDGDGRCNAGDSDDDGDGVADVTDLAPLNPTVCRDVDADLCDDCTLTGADGSGGNVGNDGLDSDADGKCNTGDPDDDGDGVLDGVDVAPLDSALCADADVDSCDDCSATRADGSGGDVSNDGLDTDSDGRCDAGDSDDDNDGVSDASDASPLNPLACKDSDVDSCDDCSITGADNSGGSTSNDGADFDADGLCNTGDADDDNDGATDANDSNDSDPRVCSDTDADRCDDCTSGTFSPGADGADSDGDGLCDAGDPDLDNDGVLNANDNCPLNANATQLNHDGDSQGDLCDADDDNDGATDIAENDAGTNSLDGDSDDDGVLDGNEGGDLSLDTDSDGLINALDPDSDNDGLYDGTENSVVVPAADTNVAAGAFVPDADPRTKSDPLTADTDGGGVKDGSEDANHNGRIEAGETDPNVGADDSSVADTDHDGISDSEELFLHTNPNDADSDDDGVLDGAEPNYAADSDGDGLINALDPDSDNDGLYDGTELGVDQAPTATDVSKGHFIADADPATTTNPLDADTDDGGVKDGVEDANRDGKVDADERDPSNRTDDATPPVDSDGDGLSDIQESLLGTNPRDADSDDDGVLDGAEPNYGDDTDGDGVINALDPDSDNDGLFDGTEMGVTVASAATDTAAGHFVADADPATRTSPVNADTDRGGVPDGIEDENHNGQIDSTEGNPNDAVDDDVNRDRDGDGIKDIDEGVADSDGDGTPNFLDLDSDGDGISDHDEAGDSDLSTAPIDTDGDGTPDFLDVDSDNDSISDKDEAGDDDKTTAPVDSDGDGIADYLDLDSDGDTISDQAEAGDADPATGPVDTDGDDVPDYLDTDTDNDGIGDSIEAGDSDLGTGPVDTDGDGTCDWRDTDSDNDGVTDGEDNCRIVVNVDQRDTNADHVGDACQDDADGDGVKDTVDNCPLIVNPDQVNSDGAADGGDACDADDDNDGVTDNDDNCPITANTDQINIDGSADGGDVCDVDDDNDGKNDESDNCPMIANTDQADKDADGAGDVCDSSDDSDADRDGIKDASPDNCKLIANNDQADRDGDGSGDACDADKDGNGFDDSVTVAGGGCATGGSNGSLLQMLTIGMVIGGLSRRRRQAMRAAAVVSVGLGAVAAAVDVQSASAQVAEAQNFSVERFSISQDRNGILSVESGALGERLSWDMHLWLGSANDPLNIYSNTMDGGHTRVGTLVRNRLGGELGGSVVALHWLQVAADLPLIFDQSRDATQTGVNGMLSDIGGVGLGDLRVSPKAQLLRGGMVPFDLALTAEVTLPTASAANYRGETGATVYPFLSLSGTASRLRWAVNLGYLARKPKAIADLKIDDELRARAGIGVGLTKELELGLNASVATAANDPFGSFGRNYSEVLAGPTYVMDSKWVLFAAAGAGLQAGYGSPDWRALAGLRVGRFGDASQAVTAPASNVTAVSAKLVEPLAEKSIAESAPPVVDSDGDGISDAGDKCPNDAEDQDGVDDSDGCAEDNDQDGVADAADKCAMQAGPAANAGCPDVDRDGDSVVDRLDSCPDQVGAKEFGGCKTKSGVAITDGGIQLVDVVYFKTDNDVILTKSYKLLDGVADIIKSHPDLPAITIEGHTDDRGNEAHNMDLSQRRAESVRAYLVRKGVAADKLLAKGFGPTKPIASNGTDRGRSTNRRVEFKIDGVDAVRTGPVDTFDKAK